MIDPELRRFIVEEVKRQTAVILSGTAGANTPQTEAIDNLYPGMPTLSDRPLMHPYGLVSRAVKGTVSVTGRQGDNPANRLVLGHRDPNRPPLLEGELIAYNSAARQVRLLLDKIQIGGADSEENIVLGQQLKAYLTILDTAVQGIATAASTIGSSVAAITALFGPGAYLNPIAGPVAMAAAGAAAGGAGSSSAAAGAQVGQADANFVANDVILSDESFARKSG